VEGSNCPSVLMSCLSCETMAKFLSLPPLRLPSV
jgi:hypothetical protein